MNRIEQISYHNSILLEEMPEYRAQAEAFPQEASAQRRLLRSLMNVRPPRPLKPEFLAVQDELLSFEREENGVVRAENLPACARDTRLAVWQGDTPGWPWMPLWTPTTALCWAASAPATAASTMPSTRRRGFSSGTNAMRSCSIRATWSSRDTPS